jgi:putative restriction endonuclease
LNITRILEAAHIVPVEDGGSDDPRNGILLSPNAHRAFDAGMWTIHPKTLEIVESEKHKEFEVLKNLKFEKTNIKDLINKPAQEALDFRYDLFQQAN